MSRSWLAGVAIVLVVVASCKRPAKTIYSEAATYPKVVDEATKAMPPDLYAAMPLYPGARVEHVRKPTHSMREILFSTDAGLAPLIAYYKEQLPKHNFQIVSTLTVPARQSWSCSFYESGRPGNLLVYPDERDKSRMTIALMYVLPDKPNDMYIEPKEEFDVTGPGATAQNPAASRN